MSESPMINFGGITPNKFEDCHIFSLPSQGNIYTLSRLSCSSSNGRTRLLVASLRRPVFLLEFNKGYKQMLVPYSRELSFTYLSGNAEIVSITSFSKPASTSICICVGYVKAGNTDTGQCLNIFTVKENGNDLNGEGLAFSCSVEIDFIPYHLTHCAVSNDVAIVLSGSDNYVHIFHEDSITHVAYERTPIEAGFAEFANNLPSVALWIEFYQSTNFRLTAIGCECGSLFLHKINVHSENPSFSEVAKSWSINLGTSITCCRFFPSINQSEKDQAQIHLLVTSALLPASVYMNVLEKGFEQSVVLTGSEKHDVITCGLVCDLHMDQIPSILIGTYGQELICYRPPFNLFKVNTEETSSWSPAWHRSFSHPILAVDYTDVTGDGVKELILLTTRGVQILQHNLEEVAALLVRRFSLAESK